MSHVNRNSVASNSSRFFHALLLGMLTVLATSTALSTHLRAQVSSFTTSTSVGSTAAPLQVSVTIRTAGTLSTIAVVVQGNAGPDFAAANSGTCTAGLSYTVGQTCTVGVTFSPLYPGVRSGAVVLTASNNTVLGTQFLSGTGTGALGVFVPGMINTIAGQATWIYSGDGQAATSSSIFLPFGIAVDSRGNLFIADQGNARIRKVTAATGVISTIAGNGTLGALGDGGPATQAALSNPSSVAIDGAGNIFISDSGNDAVRKLNVSTGTLSTVAGTLGVAGYAGDGAAATAATLNAPAGIALDSAGDIFIADSANNVIRRVDAVTGIITTIAGTGGAGFSGDGALATAARLNAPWSVTPAPGGILYIADQGNNRIRMVDATGKISTIAGTGTGSFSGDGGLALQATLDSPASVAVDPAGNLYIADSGNNRVRKITYGTNVINTIAGNATESITGDNGPANLAGLYGPYTLALDGQGSLYIADVFHNRIREVSSNTASLQFQPIRVGRVATPQPQTIENDGNATLNISAIQAVSNSVVDVPSTSCAVGQPLAPLNTCIIGAAFAPIILGTPVNGSISLISNAVNTPATITLTGNVLDQDPSTVSIAASANPVVVGTNVVFTVTVTSAGTVPTGQITLFDGTTVLGTSNLQSGGVANFSISTLTGGQHDISASYVGDSNNTAGTSAVLVETVTDIIAPTKLTLNSSVNSVIAGTPLTLTGTVALVNPGSSNAAFTGSVTFSDGSVILGAGSVSAAGIATLTSSTLSIGQHSITASYSGASSFSTSNSSSITITVQAGTSATTLASSANPSPGGNSITLSTTVTSNGVTPTGSITFADGTTPLGTASLTRTGTASLTAKALAVGPHAIVATYAGDNNNAGSASPALLQTVTIATTSTTVTSSLPSAPQGGPVVFSAAVKGNGGIPTGTVQFLDNSSMIGTGKLDATGAASYSTTNLALGAHTITAAYLGDALDSPSNSGALQQTIISATSALTFTSSANPAVFGSALALNLAIQGTGAQPTGSITLMDGQTSLGTQALSAAGTASFSGSTLSIGLHTLSAIYSGDPDHAATTATLTQHIVESTSTSLTSSAPNANAGASVTWTASVAGSNKQPITGTITFQDGTTALAAIPVNASGAASYNSAALAIGTHTMTAVYSGDTLNQNSSSTPLLETVILASTSTSLISSANPTYAGANLTLTASVSGNGGVPTGTLVMRDGTAVLGTLPVSATGAATLTLSTLAPGTHNLTATYSGDTNDATSTSATLTQSIVQQTTATTSSSANPSNIQDSVAITVAVFSGLAANPPTGLVTLTDGANVIGTASVDALGNAHFTLTAPALGQHSLVATYAGDSHNSPATAPALIQNVILRPTTNSFTTSASALSSGQQVNFISLVQGVGPNFPTGTVTFVSGSTVLGTATLNANGLATLNFVPQQGTYNVVAKYPGDALFAASNSTATAVIVGPTVEFTMNVTPPNVSMASGDHTTLNITIASASTFTDTLAIGCAGLPASATCTFSSNNVKVSGGSSAQLTVVLDTGNPLGAGTSANASLAPRASTSALACILPGGALLALLLLPIRRFRKQLSLFAMLLLMATVATLSGCANSLTTNDTPAGNYIIQVVGTGAATGATQSGTITLTVNSK